MKGISEEVKDHWSFVYSFVLVQSSDDVWKTVLLFLYSCLSVFRNKDSTTLQKDRDRFL